MKRMGIALAPLWLLSSAAPATAQLQAALDVGFDHAYVWRGLARVSRPSIQPAATIALSTPRVLVSAGAWALLEPFAPRARDLTLAGPDALLGQLDAWAEARARLAPAASATVGVVRRNYPQDAGPASPARDLTELYAGLVLGGRGGGRGERGWPRTLPLGVSGLAVFDLGPVGGTYAEAGVFAELPVLFVGEPLGAATLRLTSGWSWHQEASAPEGGYYAGQGLTHLALGAEVSPFLSLLTVPATLQVAGTVQYGVDEATLRRGTDPGDRARWQGWLHLTLSLLWPLRRQP